MRVTPPLTINSGMLVTSVAEPSAGESAWNAATSYAEGAEVIRVATHRRYQRLAPGGVDAATPESAPTKWQDIGPTNAWAMIDLERSTQTSSASAIVVTVTPGQRITSLGLVGLHGASVLIEMHEGATSIYSRTINLLLRATTTWRQYFFGAFRVRPSLVVYDLPMSTTATVTVTIQPHGGSAKCGGVVLGTDEYLGLIVDEPSSEVLNFSKVTRDDFGNATLVRRRNVPVLDFRLIADAGTLNRLRELRDELDAVPALWSGKDGANDSPFFDALLILGVAKKFTISMRGPDRVSVQLQLEEL